MIFDGKAVRFILDPGDEFEAFAVGIYLDFPVLIIQASRPVVVIFDHAADRDGQAQLL